MISTLDRKLVRDLRRIWPQALAIALVVASGFATLILGIGAHRSLEETRSAYYERNVFADIFASLERAPKGRERRILEIPGVQAAETRIVKNALLDVKGVSEPATGLVMSLPDHGVESVNRLYMRSGRRPEPGAFDEVVVNESFALANKLGVGGTFAAILNGKKRHLQIVGTALSPEFIYAMPPGELVPDDRRFAILWMSEKALGGLYDLDGAFNAVAVKLRPGTSEGDAKDALDTIIEPFGGVGAYGRSDQRSHAFLDSELSQLHAMSRIIPPIFLAVSAFLMNMTLSRLVALEREQIGLLKALGYSAGTVAAHYLKLVVIIAAIGSVVGAVAGTWLSHGLTRLYSDFFHFPFRIYARGLDLYALAGAISLGAAMFGALRAVQSVLVLPPAVAMQPPAPPLYRKLLGNGFELTGYLSQLTVMALRSMVRTPIRAGTTMLGVALAVSLLITAMFTTDSVEFMIDVAFFKTSRQHATLSLTDEKGAAVLGAIERLPGVMRAEPYLSVSVRLRNGYLSRRTSLIGKPQGQDLSLIVDTEFRPVEPPQKGILISGRLAKVLNLTRGDPIEVELLQGRRNTVHTVVTDIIEQYLGTAAYMDQRALADLVDEGPSVTGVHVSVDTHAMQSFYDAVKETPSVASLSLQRVALAKFRETIGRNISIMTTVYVVLSVIIAGGVVYNSARIALSERARELASLRVLGFTPGEVSRVLLTELAILVLLAQPLGWLLGHIFARSVISGFSSDLFTVPFVIHGRTYAMASLVVLAAASASALIVRRRIDRLDLIAVLKTRD